MTVKSANWSEHSEVTAKCTCYQNTLHTPRDFSLYSLTLLHLIDILLNAVEQNRSVKWHQIWQFSQTKEKPEGMKQGGKNNKHLSVNFSVKCIYLFVHECMHFICRYNTQDDKPLNSMVEKWLKMNKDLIFFFFF